MVLAGVEAGPALVHIECYVIEKNREDDPTNGTIIAKLWEYNILPEILPKDVKNKKFGTKVKAILAEEKRHLQLCTRLAKLAATSS